MGPFEPDSERFAGTEMRKLCRRLGLCLANTFDRAGPTYFPVNPQVAGKRLDCVLCGGGWFVLLAVVARHQAGGWPRPRLGVALCVGGLGLLGSTSVPAPARAWAWVP